MTDDFTPFRPDYAIPPGVTLREVISRLDMSQAELADRTNLSAKHINQIVQGIAPLTYDTALLLERVTGVAARIWNQLEADYRDVLVRLDEQVTAADRQWLRSLPLKSLRDAGLVPRSGDEKETLRSVLQFFGVASRGAYERTWLRPAADFKRSKAFKADAHALAAWLRLGEIDAQRIRTEAFDRQKFRSALVRIRALTREDEFADSLRALCAEAGVAVVFVPELPGCRVSGATRWLTPHKAVIQLSDRYKHDDNFWFAFFHEAGHVLLHSKRETFIEDGGAESAAEAEANEFAQDALIPPDLSHELLALTTDADVARFAKRIGVAPGLIVGRLHNDGLWPWSRGNRLRRKLTIVSDED